MSEQLKAHREYLEGCEKRALSKLQATRAVVKAARCIAGKEHLEGTHKCIPVETIYALRDALSKLDGGR